MKDDVSVPTVHLLRGVRRLQTICTVVELFHSAKFAIGAVSPSIL